MPRRIVKVFARGLASSSLYGQSSDELLQLSVGEARARYIKEGAVKMTAKGWLLFGLAVLAGGLVAELELVFFVPLVPIGLLSNYFHKKSAPAAIKTA